MVPAILLAIVMSAGSLFAQPNNPTSLAGLVLAETPVLDSAPNLAAWRRLHPSERLKAPAYDNEYETQGLWCAASIAEFSLPGDVKATRLAFFYVPAAKPGEALPARQDSGLVRQCRLLALWYEVHDPVNPSGLARSVSTELAASLGSAEEPPRFRRTDGDWGSGYWKPYLVWERANRRTVLAFDPGGNVPDPHARTRLLVIARASPAPRGLSFHWSGDAPKSQPALKERPGITTEELARIARVEKPCAFDDGSNNWQEGLIAFGAKLLRDFPESRWKPWVHLTMARASAARLLLAEPGVDLNGANRPVNPEILRRNAIEYFRLFLDENRETPESGSAWTEAWRLLAGLPPSPIHFACTD
ncbi:MAG TPA: hypothetical protein VHY84_21265 [Bryobacteraceae bacterium]|jgi:hypothetical protein|nr:hypothetical protein [Bryobacteraceae bacterium]